MSICETPIFGPGTNLADAADEVLRLLGHNRPPLDEAAEGGRDHRPWSC